MSKHFCCCIPVRLAVFILSLLSFLSSAATAGLIWFGLNLIDTGKLSEKLKEVTDQQQQDIINGFAKQNRWAIIIGGVIFTFIAIVSLFGFIGSVIRNRRMVKAYSALTIAVFCLNIVASGFLLYLTFNNSLCVKIDGEKHCLNKAEYYGSQTGSKVGTCIAVAIDFLIQLYIVIIIRRYATQLEEEQTYRDAYRLNPTSNGTYEAKHYPYSDPSNSFGHNGSHA